MLSTASFLQARAEIKNLPCELASNAKIWGARASEHSFKFCEQLKIVMEHSSPLVVCGLSKSSFVAMIYFPRNRSLCFSSLSLSSWLFETNWLTGRCAPVLIGSTVNIALSKTPQKARIFASTPLYLSRNSIKKMMMRISSL